MDSFRFTRIALAAQRALAARFEQDTNSLFAERRTLWRSVAAWRLVLFPFFFLFELTNAHILYQNLHSRLRSPILAGFKADYEASSSSLSLLGRATSGRSSLVVPAEFSYLNQDGRALVSLTADDIPTGSKAIVARLCLHRERTSPLSVSLPPPPRLPPPRPFLSTLRFFSLSTLSLLIIETLSTEAASLLMRRFSIIRTD